jgi:hypothetical protein
MQYQYNIAGNIPSGTLLCISGGKLSDSSTCDNDLSSGFVKIVWSGKSGSVTLTSDGGNVSKAIRITLPLQPGDIETAAKSNSLNTTILRRPFPAPCLQGAAVVLVTLFNGSGPWIISIGKISLVRQAKI